MKERKGQPKPEAASQVWQKTQYANLIRYVPSGGYYARFRVAGKLIWRSLKTDRITVAQMRLADEQAKERKQAASQERVEVGIATVGDALKLFVARIQGRPNLKPRTKFYYEERVTALKKTWPGLAGRRVKDITKDDCLAWAARFGTSNSAVAYNHTASVLKRTFDLAVETGARYDNPAVGIEWLRERPKRLVLPEPSQFERFVEEIENAGGGFSRNCAELVRFLAYGGFRVGEARFITWADCDFARGKIIVRGHPETGTKNAEVREVPMIPDMRALLKRLRADRPDDPPTAAVMQVRECLKAMDRAARVLGMARITHHDLRHMFATRCIESGVDIPTVSRWLGHMDGGALAMRVYGHLRDAHSVEMAQRVTFGIAQSPNVIPIRGKAVAA